MTMILSSHYKTCIPTYVLHSNHLALQTDSLQVDPAYIEVDDLEAAKHSEQK